DRSIIMPTQVIRGLFANKIDRHIEEVIKVDQTDEEILRDEIDEYVVTDAIRAHYTNVFDLYRETPNKPHEGIGVWVSGFFGSGKSSFAKILGYTVGGRSVGKETASQLFLRKVNASQKADDARIADALNYINTRIPTHAVIFDVSMDRGIRTASERITEIMYKALLRDLDYPEDFDLAELEITL